MMLRWVAFVASGVIAGSAAAAELDFDFSSFPLNQTPPGFRSTVSGQGKAGDWRIVMGTVTPTLRPLTPEAQKRTERAVLAQLARDPTDEHFPLLIYEKAVFGDFTLATRFKTVAGKAEEMAGIAFRIQDEKNYYVARASSLGSTFRFYKVVDGERGPPIGVDVVIPRGTWHTLGVQCAGNQIRCLLDGKEVIPALTDNSFVKGKIGFWTKSDSVSYFADTRIVYTPLVAPAELMVEELLRRYPRLVGLKVFATNGPGNALEIVASNNTKELGERGGEVEHKVVAHDAVYYGRTRDQATVTLPLHDRNGDPVAAVRIVLRRFPGQTEDNAVARARPIARQMESRIRSARDLIE